MAPKACVRRIVPQVMRENIRDLVRYYAVVPLTQLTALYYMKYNEVLDACIMGFDTGLMGLVEQMADVIEISDDKNPVLTLRDNDKENQRSRRIPKNLSKIHLINLLKSYRDRLNYGSIFDRDNNLLWNYGTDQLLSSTTELIIVKSPFELLYEKDPIRTIAQKKAIQKALSQYPNGIYVHQLPNIHHFNKIFFNVQSIGQLVSEYPELFYHKESEIVGVDHIVFDGATKTYFDVDELSFEGLNINPWILGFKCLQTGLYQKTLILLRQAGPNGLKVGVWFNSIERNFKQFDAQMVKRPKASSIFQSLITMQPLHLALALNHLNFICLKTGPELRNDLRLHLPLKTFEINDFFEELKSKINNKQD